MDARYADVPDSTDWLSTPLAGFAQLEGALHCQICKEFYDTPMITSCNHTFCSRCIRTSLQADGKCPTCRSSDQASKLRNNWAVQEVVTSFLDARPSALKAARQAQEDATAARRPAKRKRAVVLDSDDVVEAEVGRTTRSKSRRLNASQTSQPETIEIEDSGDDGDFSPEKPPDDGLVECPLGCGRRMKIEAVEPHLDKCEDERRKDERTRQQSSTSIFSSSRPPSSQATRPQDRISELNYSMTRDAAMSKKLKDLGIANWGTKQVMTNRHKEWVNIWNANCDSSHPRTKRDLLRDLDAWERSQGGLARPNGQTNGVMRKDFDADGWASRNKDDFSRLIADARRRKPTPATPGTETLSDKVPDKLDTQDLLHRTTPLPSQQTRSADIEAQGPKEQSQDREPLANVASSTQPTGSHATTNVLNLTSIRAKIAAANAGHPIEPTINAGFSVPGLPSRTTSRTNHHHSPSSSAPPPSIFSHSSEFQPSPAQERRRSNASEGYAGPPSLQREGSSSSSTTKMVPMFDVPRQPVTDVENSGSHMS